MLCSIMSAGDRLSLQGSVFDPFQGGNVPIMRLRHATPKFDQGAVRRRKQGIDQSRPMRTDNDLRIGEQTRLGREGEGGRIDCLKPGVTKQSDDILLIEQLSVLDVVATYEDFSR